MRRPGHDLEDIRGVQQVETGQADAAEVLAYIIVEAEMNYGLRPQSRCLGRLIWMRNN